MKTPLLRPSRSTTMRSATARTSSMLWLIMMTPRPRSRSALDQVQHLGGLRDAERGGRLVEHDDLRVEQQRAGDGDGLALAARQRGDRLAHARDAGGELARAASRRGPPSPPRRAATGRSRGRGRGWRRRRGSRRARGPGRRWRCRASARRSGRSSVTGLPWKSIVPEVGWCTPASTLTSVDLPAPLSPTSATTSPAWTSRSMSVSADTAPKFLRDAAQAQDQLALGRAARRCGHAGMSSWFGSTWAPAGAKRGRATDRRLT